MNIQKKEKIIDFHVHIGLKEHWHEWVHDYQKSTNSEFYTRYEEMISPVKFASYLKSHQIDKAVLLPEISPVTSGIVSNEYILEFSQGHNIFIPFCTINPFFTNNPVQELREFIKQGAKGLKLYPPYNYFYPNESSMYPVYALAQEERLPVLIHTGSSVFRGSRIKYADPIYLDDVATDFPELPLMMAHSGRGLWYEKAFLLSRLHPNLYLEISGLPPKNLLNYFPDMEKNIDKFIYGSDWPGIRTISTNIEIIKTLPLAEESLNKIFFRNAARILRI